MAERKRKDNYQIIIWIYQHTRSEDRTSKERLENKMRSLDDGKIERWKQASGDKWYTVKPTQSPQTSLKEYVDEENQDYINIIQRKIESTNKETELRKIAADSEVYEPPTVERVNQLVNNKIEQLSTTVKEETYEKYKKRIESAKSPEDIEDISQSQIKREANEETAREVALLRDERLNEFESLEQKVEKDLISRIESASTLSELQSIDTSKAVTTRSEEELNRLIEEKTNELS